MKGLSKVQRDLLAITTAFKLLLFPAYRSTDFEVHRNWLAITHNLPLREWYYDTTSEWTLDYPPLFAFFSYLLTLPARILLPNYASHLLELSSPPVEGSEVTAYMRGTVLLSELVMLVGLLSLLRISANHSNSTFMAIALALHPGFVILDSIHFQYNGFLFGIMIWSLVGARQGRPLKCAACFAALLNFKHIYVYLAPAWFVYLLRAFCMPSGPGGLTIHLKSFIQIGLATIFVFALSIGPFLILGQGQQLLSRLFPFTRGLMHTYWAPNAWACVTLLDRVLLRVAKRLHMNLAVSSAGIASNSRGLVGHTSFAVLPDVKPIHCFGLTLLSQMIQLIPLWTRPTYKSFLKAIAACGFSSFMFGWHVHEKAVMLILVPLSLLATEDWNHYQAFVTSSVSGLISLFPLLFKAAETPVKMGYSSIWLLVVCHSLRSFVSKPAPTMWSFLADNTQTLYLATSLPLLVFTSTLHPSLSLSGHIPSNMEFLPLMITSVWCSVGMWIAWARLTWGMWRGPVGEVDIMMK